MNYILLAGLEVFPFLVVGGFAGLRALFLPRLIVLAFFFDASLVLGDLDTAVIFRLLPFRLYLALLDVLGLEFLHFARDG